MKLHYGYAEAYEDSFAVEAVEQYVEPCTPEDITEAHLTRGGAAWDKEAK